MAANLAGALGASAVLRELVPRRLERRLLRTGCRDTEPISAFLVLVGSGSGLHPLAAAVRPRGSDHPQVPRACRTAAYVRFLDDLRTVSCLLHLRDLHSAVVRV